MSYPVSYKDATDLAEMVRGGQLSVAEVVRATIGRAEAANGKLNAIVVPTFERALDEAVEREGKFSGASAALAPLAGVPILLKDLFCAKIGDTGYQGNRRLQGLDYRYRKTSSVVRRLEQAGTISLGRSHSSELGCGNCTAAAETELYGPARNPWDPRRSPMGSSGGAAAAVAGGIVPIAHASDGGGSIRIPASACGLVGLKPSRARISTAPAGEGWAGGVSDGVVSRTVRDTALALDVLAGPEPGDPYAAPAFRGGYVDTLEVPTNSLRVGLCFGLPYAPVHPECAKAVHNAGTLFEALGHFVEVAHPAGLDSLDYLYDYIAVIRTSLAVEMMTLSRELGFAWTEADVENGTWVNYQRGLKVSGVDYAASVARMHRWTREVVSWWHSGHDLLVMPTFATPPPALGYLVEGEDPQRQQRLAETIPFTPQFNVTGQPAISVPLHMSPEGWPIGVQMVAAPGREDLLLQVAAGLEAAAPWDDRQPQVYAT